MNRSFTDMLEEVINSGRVVSNSYVLAPQEPTAPVIDTTAREVSQPSSPMPMPVGTYIPTYPTTSYQDDPRIIASDKAQTWAEIQRFACAWKAFSHTQKQPSPGELIPLAGEDAFSSSVARALGECNITNTHGLDDINMLIAMFEGLVEHEAAAQFRDDNRYLKCIANLQVDNVSVSGEMTYYGRFSWRSFCEHKGTGFVSLIQYLLNLPRLDALATLATIVNMDFAHMFQLSSQIHVAERIAHREITDRILRTLLLPHSELGEIVAHLTDLHNIRGNAGQIIGAVAVYNMNGRIFCLPATVGNGSLCIGRYKPTAHFLNQDQMEKRPNAPVIFCQDMRSALVLQKFIEQIMPKYSPSVIVTAHLGTVLNILPWNYFWGHDVVFVCAPNKRCMAMVKAYKEQIQGAGAKSFKVFPGFLLHSPTCDDLTCEVVGATEAEGTLLRTAIQMNKIHAPVQLIQRVLDESLSYDDFVQWGQTLSIFKAPKRAEGQEILNLVGTLPEPNLSLTPPLAYSISDVTLFHTMRPGNFVMLLGEKGAGKTQVALSSCGALLKSNAQWPFFRGRAVNVGNVAYVDAETPYDEYTTNLDQHGLAAEKDHRFFGLSRFDPDLPEFCDVFSITNEHFREGLFRYLLQRQCRFVFLDNLTALMADAVDHGKSASDVITWIEKLQKAGLCVVLIHHKAGYEAAAPNTDRARGSQLFSIRARTIIALLSRTEILNNHLGTEAVQALAARDGLTVGIRFTASKTAPILEKKTFWLHLPLGASQWEFQALTDAGDNLVDWQPEAEDLESNTADSIVATSVAPIPAGIVGGATDSADLPSDCTEDEIAAYKRISKAGKAQSSDIQTLLGCKGTKAGMILNSLTTKGIIERHGNGPATHYRLTTK